VLTRVELAEGRRLVERQRDVEDTRRYLEASQSFNTTRAYRSDWEQFAVHCRVKGLLAMPAAPETVADYVSALAVAGRKVWTIQRRLSGIARDDR